MYTSALCSGIAGGTGRWWNLWNGVLEVKGFGCYACHCSVNDGGYGAGGGKLLGVRGLLFFGLSWLCRRMGRRKRWWAGE